MHRHLRLALVAALVLSAAEAEAEAATFRVNSTSDAHDGVCDEASCTLRDAVDVANRTPGPDIVVLPIGKYAVVSTTCLASSPKCGHISITDDLSIQGAGSLVTSVLVPELSAVSARIFDVEGPYQKSIKVSLRGLTIRRGRGPKVGGAIRVHRAHLTVEDAILTENSSGRGGAIYSSVSGRVDLHRVSLYNNSAAELGGALYLESCGANLVDVTLSENVAGTAGGGLVAAGGAEVTMDHVSMVRNSPDAIHSQLTGYTPGFTIRNSLFSGDGFNCTGTMVFAGSPYIKATYSVETKASCGFGNVAFAVAHNREMVAPEALVMQTREGGTPLGPLPFHAPVAGGPAVDGGDPGSLVLVDQNNRPRPVDYDLDGAALPDIGAVELPRPLTLGAPPRIKRTPLP